MRYSPWPTQGRQRGYLLKTHNLGYGVGIAPAALPKLASGMPIVQAPGPASATLASAVSVGRTMLWWSAGSTAATATVRAALEVVDIDSAVAGVGEVVDETIHGARMDIRCVMIGAAFVAAVVMV